MHPKYQFQMLCVFASGEKTLPGVVVEPTSTFGRGILSPLCLPVSSPRPMPGVLSAETNEARIGIEPMSKGVADPRLTTSCRSKQSKGRVRLASGRMEAAIGIEPMYKGFADPRLTTWLRRRITSPALVRRGATAPENPREQSAVTSVEHGDARGQKNLKLAFGLEIGLSADAQDVDAVGMVPGFVLDEWFG